MVAIRLDSRCIRSSFVINVMRIADSESLRVPSDANTPRHRLLRDSFESVSLYLIALAVPAPARPYP